MSNLRIHHAPKSSGSGIRGQGTLDLCIDVETDFDGIGMGVLSDGTPFLHQRGLASLCGIQNAHIGTLGSEWDEAEQKPRVSKIKDILNSHGYPATPLYHSLEHRGRSVYAYPDTICLAILEYYAFDAGPNTKAEALYNFRKLAGTALRELIYAKVGYKTPPNDELRWKHFHDRVSLVYDSVPAGYFSAFKETAELQVTLIQNGLYIDSNFVPDISVGTHWAKHWLANDLDEKYGQRKTYEHNYPDDYPQAASNPQEPWCYPESALGEFRRWFRESYVKGGSLQKYIENKTRKNELPRPFAQKAIDVYHDRYSDEPRLAALLNSDQV